MDTATTICLYFRGDGAARALEVFRRALGPEVSLIVHPNRDDSGYYGSADVQDVDAARAAFASARQPFPTLKAYLGILPPERDEAAPRAAPARGPGEGRGDGRGRGGESRPSPGRPAEPKPGANGASPTRAQGTPPARGNEKARPADDGRAPEGQGRKPLRSRHRHDRRGHGDRERPEGDRPD